jgi:hypothetical protein
MRAPNGHDVTEGLELAQATADLVRSRNRVVRSLTALGREVTRAFAWREWVRRRPGATLVLAFGLGFLIGRRAPPTREIN